MSIQYKGDNATLKCDKCGFEQTAPKGDHNYQFYEAGWGLYPKAKKYKHKCWNCKPVREKNAYDFVKEKFPIDNPQHSLKTK